MELTVAVNSRSRLDTDTRAARRNSSSLRACLRCVAAGRSCWLYHAAAPPQRVCGCTRRCTKAVNRAATLCAARGEPHTRGSANVTEPRAPCNAIRNSRPLLRQQRTMLTATPRAGRAPALRCGASLLVRWLASVVASVVAGEPLLSHAACATSDAVRYSPVL